LKSKVHSMITIKSSVSILVAYLTSRHRRGLRIICGGLWRKVVETSPTIVLVVETVEVSTSSKIIKFASSSSSIGLRMGIELNQRSVGTYISFRTLPNRC
jgi:hypothetical protein